jgi:hypothetical protein
VEVGGEVIGDGNGRDVEAAPVTSGYREDVIACGDQQSDDGSRWRRRGKIGGDDFRNPTCRQP